MQVASAIHLIVEVARFAEDGSRKITKITEARGLNDANQYELCDLFVNRFRGKGLDGRLIAEMEPTGQRPRFASEPYEQGLEESIRLTGSLWSK